jgi:hypothetical protein
MHHWNRNFSLFPTVYLTSLSLNPVTCQPRVSPAGVGQELTQSSEVKVVRFSWFMHCRILLVDLFPTVHVTPLSLNSVTCKPYISTSPIFQLSLITFPFKFS